MPATPRVTTHVTGRIDVRISGGSGGLILLGRPSTEDDRELMTDLDVLARSTEDEKVRSYAEDDEDVRRSTEDETFLSVVHVAVGFGSWATSGVVGASLWARFRTAGRHVRELGDDTATINSVEDLAATVELAAPRIWPDHFADARIVSARQMASGDWLVQLAAGNDTARLQVTRSGKVIGWERS